MLTEVVFVSGAVERSGRTGPQGHLEHGAGFPAPLIPLSNLERAPHPSPRFRDVHQRREP